MIPIENFGNYSVLDESDRAGVAFANICKYAMPPEGKKRGGLSYKPTGWVQYLYGENLNRIPEKLKQNDCIKNFIKELSKALEEFNSKSELKGEKMDDIKLTQEEHLKFYREKSTFL